MFSSYTSKILWISARTPLEIHSKISTEFIEIFTGMPLEITQETFLGIFSEVYLFVSPDISSKNRPRVSLMLIIYFKIKVFTITQGILSTILPKIFTGNWLEISLTIPSQNFTDFFRNICYDSSSIPWISSEILP